MFPTQVMSIPSFGSSFLESDGMCDSHDANVYPNSMVMHHDWNSNGPIPIVGPGFNNLGNSCFLNSVLQALIYMVPFSKAIITCDHKKCINYDDGNFCALCAFRAILREYVGSPTDAISPYALFNNLEKISSIFKKYVQEDAHAFLSFFLEKLENSYLKHYKKKVEDGLMQQTFGIHLQSMVPFYVPLFLKIYLFSSLHANYLHSLMSQAQCLKCSHTAIKFETRFDLSLDIQEANSLEDALEAFVQVKRITDPDLKRTCEGCNEKTFMDERIVIDKLPTVIVVHLHGTDVNDGGFDKMYKDVSFLMNMNFKPYTNTFQDGVYELYAVVVHKGGATYGHYFSFIRSYPNLWHLMEDSKVERVSVECVIQHNPCLLFYIKQGSSFCFSKLFKEISSPTSTLDGLEVHFDPSNDLENRSRCDNLMNCVDEGLRKADECSSKINDDYAPFNEKCEPDFSDGQDVAQECDPCSSDSSRSDDNEIRYCCSSENRAGETETCKPSSPDKQFDETETSLCPCFSPSDVNETAVCATPEPTKSSNQKLRILKFFADEVYEDETDNLACTILPKRKKVVLPVAKAVNGGAMHDTLNTTMRSMPNARRQALMACMPPQCTASPSPQERSKKKRQL